MSNIFKLKRNSLMFAPMEGVTDQCYRSVIHNLYPEWDTYSCDFLRVPGTNPYPFKHIEKHIGQETLANPELKSKTIYQILTSPNAYTKETVESINLLKMQWLDLNLGCPSKTVCKNKGGSYLLSDLNELRKIIKVIRSSFPGVFSCKIRVGYNDAKKFEYTLKLLEDEGVDAIKIHGRTRSELYKGSAHWPYIKQAVKFVSIPIIGNGDVWNCADIERYFDFTDCHSIMFGRSALKTPWLARMYKKQEEESPAARLFEIIKYFNAFYEETQKQNLPESSRIKRLKSVSRYLFDELPKGQELKKKFLLSKSFDEQMNYLKKEQELF